MKTLFKWTVGGIVALVLGVFLVFFWSSNPTEVTPRFEVPQLGIHLQAWHAPWPLALVLIVAFGAGLILTTVVTWLVAFGFMVRQAKFKREIRHLRREVESLRVSDLDEEVGRGLSFDDADDDDLLDTSTRTTPTRPPLSAGAASSFDDEEDEDMDRYRTMLGDDSEREPVETE